MSKNRDFRNPYVDHIKAIGIALMVLSHVDNRVESFLFLFYMGVFFVASGYCYHGLKNYTWRGWFIYVWKHLKKLYFPYVAYNVLLLLLRNMLVQCHLIPYSGAYKSGYISTSQIPLELIKIVCFSSTELLASALWFVRTLFVVLVAFSLLDFFAHKLNSAEGMPSVGWAILGFLALAVDFCFLEPNTSNFIITQIRSCALGIVCLIIGYLLKCFHWEAYHKFWHGGAALAFLLFESRFITLNSSFECVNPALFVLSVLCGWVMCWSIAEIVSTNKVISRIVGYIGQHTIWILFLHYLAIKPVIGLYALLHKKSITFVEQLMPFQNVGYKCTWYFDIMYVLAGVFAPLLIERIWHIGKKLLNTD